MKFKSHLMDKYRLLSLASLFPAKKREKSYVLSFISSIFQSIKLLSRTLFTGNKCFVSFPYNAGNINATNYNQLLSNNNDQSISLESCVPVLAF